MPKYSITKIEEYVSLGMDKSLTTKARGDALESLVCYLFGEIPGLMTQSNGVDVFKGSEIDVSVANTQEARWMQVLPVCFLVECKNWDAPVGAKEVGSFVTKLKEKGVQLGVLVAANGVTGNADNLTAAHFKIAMAQQDGHRILVITLSQLRELRTSEDFAELLCRSFLKVVASGRF
ncbi:restriction endonuclease [Streptomyces sp. Amel2xB2]|uniref:restriction endonuclease n=1 Tax=Streptomyces sp. Amel2xB2 TaxID=1305829 RepID=UPI000DBFD160|nr:restriction endonuclease [Streptomyces sp. Amel2xB2]RAJ61718.1 restriction endonuclease [Streptomyces sp. Amel2xB2]